MLNTIMKFMRWSTCVCVCVCLFFSIVRQSKQCNWIYSLWGFKCFNAKNNKTNL